ncbi:glycosyltransferase family 2 protein [Actinotalea fermentans]|nr:glycosyltransferase family 2 protein [Actinotalea fermentans]KGM17066.1 hypothetical protein N867_10565 [Actinotalea fermentans ATCC 43279 = JCM 9966 = DSM 3133]
MRPLEVVVVTYRSAIEIGDCIDSVVQYAPAGTMVHVVDNASPDGTVDLVNSVYPQVHLVARTDNAGFAVANNVALREVRSEYVLLLNPDARLMPGTVQRLIERLDGDASIGLIGCRLLREDGTVDHAAKRFIPSAREAAVYFLGRLVGKRGSRYVASEIGDREYAEVDAVSGAFMLIRTAALLRVGLFDESYWMYGEDLDLCSRFREDGWRVMYEGGVTAIHIKGASTGIRSPKLNYEFHRSMVRFFRRHGDESPLVAALTPVAIWCRFVLTVAYDEARRLVRTVSR